jgi:uncharacterized protein YvpB
MYAMMSLSKRTAWFAAALLFAGAGWGADFNFRGTQYIGLTGVSSFTKSKAEIPGDVVLTSPEIITGAKYDELIVSWNAETPYGTYLRVEARATELGKATPWFVLGLWSSNTERYPRESVLGQTNEFGRVATDTLIFSRAYQSFQIRLTLGGEYMTKPNLKYLGLNFADSKAQPPVLAPNKKAWGTVLPVPEKSQMTYPNGKELCSPTTVSMMLSYWSGKLDRRDLNRDVPEISENIFDRNWKGTGNWVFNMAYAGSFKGMRAYVTRLSDVSELEDWIAQGVPVGLSLCYDRLRGKKSGPSGHLVTLVGFTEKGEPIINDPGTSENVQKVFSRKNLINAWAYSRNAVYLIYPENTDVPKDRFAHWHSWSSRQQFSTR